MESGTLMNILMIKLNKDYFTSGRVIFRNIVDTLVIRNKVESLTISDVILMKELEYGIDHFEPTISFIHNKYLSYESELLYVEDINVLPFLIRARNRFEWFKVNFFLVCHSVLLNNWYEKWELLASCITPGDRVWITSSYSHKLLSNINSVYDTFNIIPLMIDKEIEAFENDIADYDEFSIYVGRVVEEKGISHLIDAWARCNHKHNKLYIIGYCCDDYKEYLTKKIESLNVEDYIELLGELHGYKKLVLMKRAKFTINVSIAPCETFGLSNIESLGLGTPVICSNWSAFEEVITNGYNGFIVEHRDMSSYSDNIMKVINHGYGHYSQVLRNNAKASGIKYKQEAISYLLEEKLLMH